MIARTIRSGDAYPDRRILTAAVLAAVSAALLLVVGDWGLFEAARLWQPAGTRLVAVGASWLGEWTTAAALLLAAAGSGYVLGRPRLRAAGFCALAGFALAGLVTELVKHTACRARPFAPDAGTFDPPLCLDAGLDSFPSGHASQTVAIAVVLAAVYPRLTLPLYVAAGAVGLSRLILGVHYPSDVLAGVTIGLLGGMLCRRLLRRAATSLPGAHPVPDLAATPPHLAAVARVARLDRQH
ncbi:MAG: phosphatase PAP2 family protein [Candidatus Rokubacteria bacterium]|nr:phosphatase PAP2 family protein [Candidatus Rokubacteria bacterium]